MTIPLPHGSIFEPPGPDGVAQINPQSIQDNLDALALGGDAFGGVQAQIRFGSVELSWPGGQSISNQSTVSHGLGSEPAVVMVTVVTSSQGQVVAAHAGNYSASSFDVQAEWVGGFSPAAGSTLFVAWLAVG